MYRMHAIFHAKEGAEFDWESWRTNHLALAKDKLTPLGLTGLTAQCSEVGPNGAEPTTVAVITLEFENKESCEKAFATVAPELIAHVPTFTNVQPVFTFGEVRG
jgi:uncharacterized protein (TIGR02118 family)